MAWETTKAKSAEKTLTPLKAIRQKCLDCCCDQWYEVKTCTIDWCPLYEYRFGHNPKLKGVGNINNLKKKNIIPTNVGEK